MERSSKEEAVSEFSKKDELQAAERANPLRQHPSQERKRLQN